MGGKSMNDERPDCPESNELPALPALPLAVKVAEALGCTPDWLWCCTCANYSHADGPLDSEWPDDRTIRDYTTRWEATGPLVDEFDITFYHYLDSSKENSRHGAVRLTEYGSPQPPDNAFGIGDTKLLAVCDLIVKMGRACIAEIRAGNHRMKGGR